MKIEILENYLKMEVLEIKFENRNFGKIFENGSLKIKFENWNFEELFENGILKKLNLKFEILENYLKMEVLKFGILKNYLRMKF